MSTRFNITDCILQATASFPSKTALIEKDRTLAYGPLAEAVKRLATELKASGIRPLDRVAFLCPDSIDYILLSLAILSLDAAIVPLSPSLMSDERLALCDRIDVHHILAETKASPDSHGIPLDNRTDLKNSFLLEKRGARLPEPEGYAAIRPAFIRFSSGTTGASKGVVLSHETILDRTEAANQGLLVDSSEVIGWVLSMSFHFVVTILLFLRKGATIILCGDPMPGGLIEALQHHPITLIYASPIHYQFLAGSNALQSGHFKALRMAVSTAIKLPAPIAFQFHQRFGLRLTEAYGIIEVGLPFIHRPLATHDGLLGKPLPAYQVKLEDNDEVLIRGKGMFDAYFSPWQTHAACLRDGWFHTGDIGELASDGTLRLVGRCKAVINFSGIKIFPQEVEEVLDQHPAVRESMVYGESHPEYGQIPCARVVLKNPAIPLDDSALRSFCRSRLALHKIPKAFTAVQSLQKTTSGKIIRA